MPTLVLTTPPPTPRFHQLGTDISASRDTGRSLSSSEDGAARAQNQRLRLFTAARRQHCFHARHAALQQDASWPASRGLQPKLCEQQLSFPPPSRRIPVVQPSASLRRPVQPFNWHQQMHQNAMQTHMLPDTQGQWPDIRHPWTTGERGQLERAICHFSFSEMEISDRSADGSTRAAEH